MAQKYPDSVVVGPETDWDFYGENTMDAVKTLIDLGFEQLDAPNRDYWDDELIEIYTLGDIQVLLRRDIEIYKRAFEGVGVYEFVTKLWKSSPLRPQGVSKIQFAASVCAYFNKLFAFHRGELLNPPDAMSEEVPF